jgi:hypothetical protein
MTSTFAASVAPALANDLSFIQKTHPIALQTAIAAQAAYIH